MNTQQQDKLVKRLAYDAGKSAGKTVICHQVICKKTDSPRRYLYHYKVSNPGARQVFGYATLRPRIGHPQVSIMEDSQVKVKANPALMSRLGRVYGVDWNGYSWVGKPYKVGDQIYRQLVYVSSIAAP
ncbi:MAG: hypothetical protein JW732_03805 [Dehalococcoidia bacterium]|nr:hypothetical protein [Dehalococcoidia bacterium]